MVDRVPQTKHDEQYPLLKVDGGGGDSGGHPQIPPASVSLGWGVTCAPKQSWFSRWPEFFSACWMTLILLGISFVVFYALRMSAYRRQPIILMKCNTSKPASDVYYHQIVQRGAYIPFMLYSEYLSNMAVQYPSLRLNVFFLIDDSLQSTMRAPRHSRFFNKLIPYHPNIVYNTRLEENNKREMRDFQRRYQNVNVSVMPLSKFMAMTPLRYKWRTVPISHLPFYARIFSVWQNGGVGIDLMAFKNRFNNHQNMDRRITAILRQHNDGIKPENYANTLNTIDRDDENEFFTLFFGLAYQLLNDTRSFLNKTFSSSPKTTEKMLPLNKPLIRVHRAKRELSDEVVNNTAFEDQVNINSTDYVQLINATGVKISSDNIKKIKYQTSSDSNIILEKLPSTVLIQPNNNITNSSGKYPIALRKHVIMPNSEINGGASMVNNSDAPQVVLFYDFSIFSDGVGPTFLLPELMRSDYGELLKGPEVPKPAKRDTVAPHFLSIDPEGMFIAASSRLHPFLGYLISAGCQRMHPKFAIQDAFLTQCSGIFRDDVYCSNIYVL